jgi:phage baseplate assembly protein gpV
VNIVGDFTVYSSLQTAYEAALDDDTFEVRSTSFSEDLSIDRAINVTMEASYDCLHTSQAGETTVNGNMTVSGGTIVIMSGTLKVQ